MTNVRVIYEPLGGLHAPSLSIYEWELSGLRVGGERNRIKSRDTHWARKRVLSLSTLFHVFPIYTFTQSQYRGWPLRDDRSGTQAHTRMEGYGRENRTIFVEKWDSYERKEERVMVEITLCLNVLQVNGQFPPPGKTPLHSECIIYRVSF